MAISFSYTESTNKIVATGGTTGTPAAMAALVTEDRKGIGSGLGYNSVPNYGFDNWTGDELDDWTDGNGDSAEEAGAGAYGGAGSSLKWTASTNFPSYAYVVDNVIPVVAGKKYRLKFYYKNTAGDVAAYRLYDWNDGGAIAGYDRIDLPDSTSWSALQTVHFTAPAGCDFMTPCMGAKTSGDIVWYDLVSIEEEGTLLLDAGSPASALALDYAVRPVEDLAIGVTLAVKNKTAEADYVFITGTDWHGDAQTESMDVTAGNGEYHTTKYWASITTLDCSDNANGGGNVWDDGDLTVFQYVWGVVWDSGNAHQYQIDANIDFGDDTTSTFFRSMNDDVYFKDAMVFDVKNSATLELGIIEGDWGIKGSSWSLGPTSATKVAEGQTTATINLYASHLHLRGDNYIYFDNGTVTVKNTQLSARYDIDSGIWRRIGFTGGTISLDRVYANNMRFLNISVAPTIDNLHFHYGIAGIVNDNVNVTADNTLITEVTWMAGPKGTAILTMKDPVTPITSVINQSAGSVTREEYTCNIHVVDKDGTDLAGVSVACEDTDTTAAFTTQTTAADGTITEQDIRYKAWTTTSETLKTYSPHKFTLSKAGYETLVLENVTVDGPIDWHLELQSPKQPPAPWQEGMM